MVKISVRIKCLSTIDTFINLSNKQRINVSKANKPLWPHSLCTSILAIETIYIYIYIYTYTDIYIYVAIDLFMVRI